MKLCVRCGALIPPDDVALAPGEPERCDSCAEPDYVNVFHARRRWPRVMRAVEKHIQTDNKSLAARYVQKAHNGEPLYLRIVREAFARRHGARHLKRIK